MAGAVFTYDLMGKRFGRLTVISKTDERQGKCIVWLCKCDCGKEHKVSSSRLVRGRTRSCGCLQKDYAKSRKGVNKLDKGEPSFNAMFYAYKKRAIKKKLEFSISKEEFKYLTKENCFYCDAPPAQIYNIANSKEDGGYIYNGVDRRDNTIGYVSGNCVPCCMNCNYAKRDLDEKEFIEWIEKVYNKQYSK